MKLETLRDGSLRRLLGLRLGLRLSPHRRVAEKNVALFAAGHASRGPEANQRNEPAETLAARAIERVAFATRAGIRGRQHDWSPGLRRGYASQHVHIVWKPPVVLRQATSGADDAQPGRRACRQAQGSSPKSCIARIKNCVARPTYQLWGGRSVAPTQSAPRSRVNINFPDISYVDINFVAINQKSNRPRALRAVAFRPPCPTLCAPYEAKLRFEGAGALGTACGRRR